MAAGTQNDLNAIIQFGRQAARQIAQARTQTSGTGGPGSNRARGGQMAPTPTAPRSYSSRQGAMASVNDRSRSVLDNFAGMRAQPSRVRAVGATSLTPPPPATPREFTPRTSPDQRRRDAGQTRVGYVDDQEARYAMARANNEQSQARQDAPFDQFAQMLGFGVEQPIALGQTEDGKYAGFSTQTLMKDAVEGRGMGLRDEGAGMAADVRGAADKLEHDTEYLARRELAGMGDDVDTLTPGLENLNVDLNPFGGTLNPAAVIGRRVEEANFGDYRDQLASWRAAEDSRATQGQELADEIEGIPYHQWVQLAAMRDYGIDPNITAGMFDASLDTKEFKAGRDSQYLQQYGMPYSEVQAAEKAQEDALRREQDMALGDQEDAFVAAQDDYVFEETGINGNELAQAVDLTPDQLIAYIDGPDYAGAKAQVVEAVQMAAETEDPSSLAAISLELATYDPTLFRILQTEFDLPDPY